MSLDPPSIYVVVQDDAEASVEEADADSSDELEEDSAASAQDPDAPDDPEEATA